MTTATNEFLATQTEVVKALTLSRWIKPTKHSFGVMGEAKSGRVCLYVFVKDDGSISGVKVEHIYRGTQYLFTIGQIAENIAAPSDARPIDVLKDLSPPLALELLRSRP